LASLHELVDLVELRETDSLEGDLDETAAEEVNGLSGISTVADVRSLDGDHANNCVEDGSRELSIGGETNADDSTARADVLGSLLEGLLVGSDEESSVRSETIGGGSLDISDKVLGCGKVDISSSSELLGELSLLLTTIDGNGVDTHGLAVLDSDGTETTTSTDDGNGLTGLDTGLLKTLVDGDTGAENGGDGLEVALLRNASNVDSLGNGVLLERSIDGVTGEESLGAERLIGVLAVRAAQARTVEPLDTDLLANLDILDKVAAGNDNTSTLVATDKRQLGIEGPVTLPGMEISVADTGELDVDEDLIGTGLLDGNLLVLDRTGGLLENLSPLLLGNLGSGHFDCWSEWLAVWLEGYRKVVVKTEELLRVLKS
jgi:hypothetical protein